MDEFYAGFYKALVKHRAVISRTITPGFCVVSDEYNMVRYKSWRLDLWGVVDDFLKRYYIGLNDE